MSLEKKAFVLQNEKKVKFEDYYLDDLIQETFQLSKDVLRKIVVEKDSSIYRLVFYFNTLTPHKIEIEFELISPNNYKYSMLADNKAIRLDAKLAKLKRSYLKIFFTKLDKAISLLPSKFNMAVDFRFNDHKLIVQTLDAISQLIIY